MKTVLITLVLLCSVAWATRSTPPRSEAKSTPTYCGPLFDTDTGHACRKTKLCVMRVLGSEQKASVTVPCPDGATVEALVWLDSEANMDMENPLITCAGHLVLTMDGGTPHDAK